MQGNKKSNKIFEESEIIKNKEDIDLLISFLPKKPVNTSLLFNSNIDGDTLENFHLKVDKKSPTFIIIKSEKDRIFGGYTHNLWNIENLKISEDNNAFVFSLHNKTKYNVTNPKKAIVERKDYFQFGTCCFRINNNCTTVNNILIQYCF